MNNGRRLFLLLLGVQKIHAISPVNLTGKTIEGLEGGSVFSEHLRESENALSSLKNIPTLKNEGIVESTTFRKLSAAADVKPVEKPVENLAGEYCHRARYKRNLVLVRRGCFGTLGSGLLATSEGLEKAGARLNRFERYTGRQKLRSLTRKMITGVKYTAAGAVAPVAVSLAIAGGITLITLQLTWDTLSFIYRTGLHFWKYFGKGLTATGRAPEMTGSGVEVQAAKRLTTEVPPPEHVNGPRSEGWNQENLMKADSPKTAP
ncbi:hypothetical protein MJO28_001218 [Puccinia striiformis f. sp. tritici]|uniref:Uncharacterized protein n=3 Tax=Puccinia striiformis TaxID=27350 RepID=A0A0L0UZI5_9BASI|nr:hypothetical protein Pst134EA_000023 [Puccinia striiformis f. sp. tritici]KAI9601717.1 hypothetical protein H4Q26_001550 [Puccinia striiformis f. sp. tritici PST-130]KNE92435.1 hypothetical protein PSTG_14156 [Puccinia striiformis f. sp. tritici PST-78]POW07843.1 hypothetical protein PSHT_09783 [Puccinia striiformis]KAH9466148.1 hypothetical protein Pst134EB_001212 [Puccinia striiformis f. sp. tritici]KAH9472939.1 hypothetical protein Pst134EA_000023 [Puccinia striiformis f. sp. tritici]